MSNNMWRRIGAAFGRVALPGVVAVAVVAIAASLPAQAQEPWETSDGRNCIDDWIAHVSSTLNNYGGDAEFNSRKPWDVNRFGLFVGQGIRSAYEPDNWGLFGADRYRWMWGNYTTEEQFPDWNNPNFNASGLQGLRWYVRDCVGGGGGLSGNTGQSGQTVVSPPTDFVLDDSAACPGNFSMHSGTTVILICYCGSDSFTGGLWGTGIYTADSSLCGAARHVGVVGAVGGTIMVQGATGQQTYAGTTSNSITSTNFGAYGWSFRFPSALGTAQIGPAIEACAANMTDLRGTSTVRTCHCAPDAMTGTVWGTDVYTDDSALCAAALHAGAVGANGGIVTAVATPGLANYNGSIRNGITSRDYGTWTGSFYFD